jgi:S-(hydroxymethyl)glutathione dehydrogenase / alcohol dehydrogenase
VRAALLEAPGEPLDIVDDVDVEAPRDDEVLVRVTHCGVCHSDLHLTDGSIPFPLPAVCGHEPAGVVEATGKAVFGLAPGDKVVLAARSSCGRCYWCARGQPHLCAHATELFTGMREDFTSPLSRHGAPVFLGTGLAAFAEQAVARASSVVKVPDDTPLDVAAVLGCAVQTGVGAALNTARVQQGDTVLVVGLGGIGIAIVQGARIAGASRIIGVDPVASRREQAVAFGVTDAVETADAVLDLTGGIGVDNAFEAVGRAALGQACLAATRNGGTTTLVGVAPLDQQVHVDHTLFAMTEKRLLGCLLGSSNPPVDIPKLLALWRDGRLDLEGMITARRPLDQINEAFADMKAGVGLRTVLYTDSK